MSLTKKKKFLLKWVAPASFLVLGVSIAAPIVVISQQNNERLVKESKNIVPNSFNTLNDAYLNSLRYNPKDYDIRFFSEQIINSYLKNEVFAFNFEGFSKIETNLKNGTKNVYWKDSNGVCYYIDQAKVVLGENNSYLEKVNSQGQLSYVFNLSIYKYKERAIEIKYQEEILIPKNYFVDSNKSRNNFLAKSAKYLNEIFINKEDILTFRADNKFTSIEELNSTNDVRLVERRDVDNYIKQYEKPNKDTYYSLEWDDFIYISDFVTFFVPFSNGSQKLIWNSSDAYSFDLNKNFNKNSQLFTFLKNAYSLGNLSYLPELSEEEGKGLSEDEKIDRRIQKLIFNPEIQPFTFDSQGNKIPIFNQAILVEMELTSNATTYIVVWEDLFTISDFVVSSALELEFKANMKNGKSLSWEEIMQTSNFGFLTPVQNPKNGLIYEVINVSFENEDTYKTKPIVKVRISHPKLNITKEYQTTIVSGFQSLAYKTLDNEISNILNGASDLSNLLNATTAGFKSDVTIEQVRQNVTNYEQLETLLNITISGLTNVKYTINQARIDGTKLFISFTISSINDPTNFWKYNNVVQSFSKTINLPENSSQQNPTTPTNLLKK